LKKAYHGPNGRFEGLTEEQLIVLSYDIMGGCTGETEACTLQLTKAIAAANPGVHYSVIAGRVRAAINCSLIRSMAANALDFRNGKLLPPSRSVGGFSASGSATEVPVGGAEAAAPASQSSIRSARKRARQVLQQAVNETTGKSKGAAAASHVELESRFAPTGLAGREVPTLSASAASDTASDRVARRLHL